MGRIIKLNLRGKNGELQGFIATSQSNARQYANLLQKEFGDYESATIVEMVECGLVYVGGKVLEEITFKS